MSPRPVPSRLDRFAGSVYERFAAEFLDATRQACLRQWQTARVYQDLAERASHPNLRYAYCTLAENAEKEARRYLGRLTRLGLRLPVRRETTWQRIARWLLVRAGPRWVNRWAERREKKDRQQLAELAQLLRRYAPQRRDS